jgi:uncharacterized protein
MKPQNIILEGITGSTAYGLNTADSDEDLKGIYVAPTSEVLGLHNIKDTIDHTEPDWTYHEVGKFIKLGMACNPTILEMLYLDGYHMLTKQGRMLVDNRHLFLSNRIRHSYGGYVFSQARKLNARGSSYDSATKNRYEKHTRHLFRLLQQGMELLETGALTVRVSNRDELFAYGKLEPHQVIDLFSEKIKEFDGIQGVLPDEPDMEGINKLLLKIRKGNW